MARRASSVASVLVAVTRMPTAGAPVAVRITPEMLPACEGDAGRTCAIRASVENRTPATRHTINAFTFIELPLWLRPIGLAFAAAHLFQAHLPLRPREAGPSRAPSTKEE